MTAIGMRAVITLQRTKGLRIIGEGDIMRFELETLSKIVAMWCRASLAGVIFRPSGSLGTLRDRYVDLCLFTEKISGKM